MIWTRHIYNKRHAEGENVAVDEEPYVLGRLKAIQQAKDVVEMEAQIAGCQNDPRFKPVLEYFNETWMPRIKMWAKAYRTGPYSTVGFAKFRDTNNFNEALHSLLVRL